MMTWRPGILQVFHQPSYSLKPMSTLTTLQINELFVSLESTYTSTMQDIDQAKESANHISEDVENLRSILEEQVRSIVCIQALDHALTGAPKDTASKLC